MVQVKIKMSRGFEDLMPRYATDGAAAFDCRAALGNEWDSLLIHPGQSIKVPLEITSEIPEGYAAILYPRSGLGSKGLRIANCVGVIDSDYRGLWSAVLYNESKDTFEVYHGERVVQAVIQKVERADLVASDNLSETVRGTGGYGSTGVK